MHNVRYKNNIKSSAVQFVGMCALRPNQILSFSRLLPERV
jgi:hypothetical protein